jgi:hypothetical protein
MASLSTPNFKNRFSQESQPALVRNEGLSQSRKGETL